MDLFKPTEAELSRFQSSTKESMIEYLIETGVECRKCDSPLWQDGEVKESGEHKDPGREPDYWMKGWARCQCGNQIKIDDKPEEMVDVE